MQRINHPFVASRARPHYWVEVFPLESNNNLRILLDTWRPRYEIYRVDDNRNPVFSDTVVK